MMIRRSWPLTVLVFFLSFTPAQAQSLADYDYENLSFRGIGLDLGYIWPTRVGATPMYSLRADFGYLGPGVRIAPSISYWNSTFRRSELNRLADQLNRLPALRDRDVTIAAAELGTIDWSSLSLAVDAHFVWTTPLQVLTYLGAGLGVHTLDGRGSAVQNTFIEDLLDSTTGGVAIMAGAEAQPTPLLRLYGEIRYTLISDVRYPGLRVGGAFMLPSKTRPAQGAQGRQGGE